MRRRRSNIYDYGMAVRFRDYYEVLKVRRTATGEEITQAYRRLVKRHHPDLHPEKDKLKETELIKEVNEAYSVLGDKENRAKYDRLGENWKDNQEFRPPPDSGFRGRPS